MLDLNELKGRRRDDRVDLRELKGTSDFYEERRKAALNKAVNDYQTRVKGKRSKPLRVSVATKGSSRFSGKSNYQKNRERNPNRFDIFR